MALQMSRDPSNTLSRACGAGQGARANEERELRGRLWSPGQAGRGRAGRV